MVTMEVRICTLTGMGIHNGQGLGTQDVDSKESGKKTSLKVVGSAWLTSIPIPNNLVAQLVEHWPFKPLVVGSNPTGITIRDVAKSGIALALGARDRWFKSNHLDKKSENK